MEPFTNHRITTAAAGLIVGMIIAMSIRLLQSTFAGSCPTVPDRYRAIVDTAGGSDLTRQELVNTLSPGDGTVVLMPSGPPGIGRPSLTGKCEPCQPISRSGVGR